jgi:diguanylate cyclase (GGDEF)-like protein
MVSSPTRRYYDQPGQSERFRRSVVIRFVAAVGVVAVMTFAAYLTLGSAISVQRTTATAIELTEGQQLRLQRIGSLTTQYGLGDAGVQRSLRPAIDSFARGQRQLAALDPNVAPLGAAATAYVAQLNRMLAAAPHDPSAAANAASAAAAQRPLLEALAQTIRARNERADETFALFGHAGTAFFTLILAGLATAALGVFQPMLNRIAALAHEIGELTRVAATDPVTGMLNKRSFQDRGTIEMHKARRYGRPLSLLVIGADQLPAIEATYGPDGGKAVLKALTSSFCDGTRVSDLIARVDDEQFAILLPETSSAGAELLAERLRRRIGQMTVQIDDKPVACTISVGVAAAEKDATLLWPTFKRADEALYEAKQRGCNRVFVAA